VLAVTGMFDQCSVAHPLLLLHCPATQASGDKPGSRSYILISSFP